MEHCVQPRAFPNELYCIEIDGGMNLLGKVDAWDNLIRIKSESVAQELMEMIQEDIK